MSCQKILKLLDDYHNGMLAPVLASEVEEHLSQCEECACEYETIGILGDMLRESRAFSSPGDEYFTNLLNRLKPEVKRINRKSIPFGWLSGAFFRMSFQRFSFANVAVILLFFVLGLGVGLNCLKIVTLEQSLLSEGEKTNSVPSLASVSPGLPDERSIGVPIEKDIPREDAITVDVMRSGEMDYVRGYEVPGNPFLRESLAADNSRRTALISSFPERETPSRGSAAVTVVEYRVPVSNLKAREALDRLQRMKFKMSSEGQKEYLPDVNDAESVIYTVLEKNSDPSDNYLLTLNKYNEAERLFSEKKYYPALKTYYEIAQMEASDRLTFMAHFQIARIEYEILQDFASAERNYKRCLEYFSESPIADKVKDYILSRVEILSNNSQEDYKPLKLYFLTPRNKPVQTMFSYKELIEKYPESSLAVSAVNGLTKLAIDQNYKDIISPVEVLKFYQQYLDRYSKNPLRGYVRLSIADIMNFRLDNQEQALLDYISLMDTETQPEVITIAQERVRDIYTKGSMANY